MPDRVFLPRHAETANPLVFHGAESDVGLSLRGRAQAAAVAPALAAEHPGAVVSSAMRRALDTADPIARACRLPVRVGGRTTGAILRPKQPWDRRRGESAAAHARSLAYRNLDPGR